MIRRKSSMKTIIQNATPLITRAKKNRQFYDEIVTQRDGLRNETSYWQKDFLVFKPLRIPTFFQKLINLVVHKRLRPGRGSRLILYKFRILIIADMLTVRSLT